jgi:hypothetical protein
MGEHTYQKAPVEPDAAVVRTWKLVDAGDAVWQFLGDCPRCTHACDKEIRERVIFMALEGAPNDRPDVGTHVVECNCTHEHPDTPEGAQGCGAYWGVQIQGGSTNEAQDARGE